MSLGFLETTPIAIVCLGVTALMLVFGEVGYRLGVHARNRHDWQAPASLGPMVGALLGMLAFVLAFTFSMASSQHDLRKRNVLQEVNAIGTAYLRADLAEAPQRDEMKQLLREYVEVRLRGTSPLELEAAIARSVAIHRLLWAEATAAARAAPSPNTALVVESVNTLIDMHEQRVTGALRNRVPGSVWIALVAIITLTMVTLGTQVGLTGNRRLGAVIPLILAFAVLVVLVVDLDRPQTGLITVGQQAMVGLQRSLAEGR